MFNKDKSLKLLDSLPDYYREAKVPVNITQSQGAEFDKLYEDIRVLLFQNFIYTSTTEFYRFEKIFGITVDETKPIEERRRFLASKMRGVGTVNASTLENILSSFTGNVVVEEVPSEYKINITFIGERGTPKQFDDIKRVIREVIPAHLLDEYVFTFVTWDEVENAGMTWDELEIDANGNNRTWSDIETMFI